MKLLLSCDPSRRHFCFGTWNDGKSSSLLPLPPKNLFCDSSFLNLGPCALCKYHKYKLKIHHYTSLDYSMFHIIQWIVQCIYSCRYIDNTVLQRALCQGCVIEVKGVSLMIKVPKMSANNMKVVNWISEKMAIVIGFDPLPMTTIFWYVPFIYQIKENYLLFHRPLGGACAAVWRVHFCNRHRPGHTWLCCTLKY
jgi:hypothetical protein